MFKLTEDRKVDLATIVTALALALFMNNGNADDSGSTSKKTVNVPKTEQSCQVYKIEIQASCLVPK